MTGKWDQIRSILPGLTGYGKEQECIDSWRFLLFRFLTFLPGVLVMMLIYLRTRRLAPLNVAHWPMDFTAAIMTGIY